MKIKNILYLFLLINIAIMPYIFTMEEPAEKQTTQTLRKAIDLDVARFLIAMSAAYPMPGSEGFTGKINFPAELLDMIAGAIISSKNGEALLKAFETDDKDEIEQLLKKRYIDVNVKGKHGWTPLMYASHRRDNIELVQMLLKKGANPDMQSDIFKMTALALAAKYNNLEIMELLLNGNADPNIGDYRVTVALLMARHPKAVNMLLDYGANINQQNVNGNTLLHSAARGYLFEWGPKIVKILLERGADINIRNNEGMTVLDEAQDNDEREIIELLTAKQ